MVEPSTGHWLDRYRTGYHAWSPDKDGFSRRCGLVEAGFDTDGRYFEGRADINTRLVVGITTRLQAKQLGHHILLAFTLLRQRHPLLAAKARLDADDVEPYFSVAVPPTPDVAIEDAATALEFVEDADGKGVDMDHFYLHAQNAKRVVDPSHALARLFILPSARSHKQAMGGDGTLRRHRKEISMLFVMAHQIADGLSCQNFIYSFVERLNTPTRQLEEQIKSAIVPAAIFARLPPAQEDIYPPIGGSRARSRWYWTLTIVLRHVKKPLPVAFANPLRRVQPLLQSRALPPAYPDIFDYGTKPPLNTFLAMAVLSKRATTRLHRLCRGAGASIGAGCFVLVAMAMMSLHESRHPDEDPALRRPFVGGFPLNPRPFIGTTCMDSVMLAFCEGIVLPFLPSDLDLEGRFRLLVRQAHRQLAVYQKRARRPGERDPVAFMGGSGAGRLIASNYVDGVEKLRAKLPAHLRDRVRSPQGELEVPAYDVRRATCGVSSVGRVAWADALLAGAEPEFELGSDELGDGGDQGGAAEDGGRVVARLEGMRSGVRARDGEFLVGVQGEGEHIRATVSFDGNAIDEERAQEWATRMREILEPTEGDGDGDGRKGVVRAVL
ncbi:hypothetical protein F5Y15DRAFT_177704 [Xylariaceae sp. FL0016]|nr:hypothetical protein F5Y15DRAFT_177704 [Xylariaceae sp. FL0016]